MRPDPHNTSNDTVMDIIIILTLKGSPTDFHIPDTKITVKYRKTVVMTMKQRAFIGYNNKGRDHSMQNNRISGGVSFCLKNPQPKLSQTERPSIPHVVKKLNKTAECFPSLNAKQEPLSYGKNVKLSMSMS